MGKTPRSASIVVAILASVTVATATQAQTSGSAFLSGGNYLQSGSVFNTSSSATLNSVIYGFGTAADGVATWDDNGGSYLGGGTPSDYLSDTRHFQTISWFGLSVAPGSQFNFSGLDIDLIGVLSPLSIDQGTLTGGLGTAFIQAGFSDGTVLRGALLDQDWAIDQRFNLSQVQTVVPEPGTMTLLATGLAGLAGVGRRRRKQR